MDDPLSTNTMVKSAILVFFLFAIELGSGIMLGHGLARKQT